MISRGPVRGQGLGTIRPPWNQTSTGCLAEMTGFLVHMFRARQSSDEGLSFWAAKFFQTRKPDGSVKLGNLDTGGLLEGQSLQPAHASRCQFCNTQDLS